MSILEEIAADIDWRNAELAELRVILHKAHLTQSQRNVYIRYIVPAIYSLWEGYIKNSLQLYAKGIHSTQQPITSLHDNLLAHAVTSEDKLALDRARIKFDTQRQFAIHIKEHLKNPFPINGKIPSKSNVNSEVLQDLFERFNLGPIDGKIGKRLDKLLRFRNTIAHGDNSIPVKEENINEFTSLLHDLMSLVFERINDAVYNRTYLRH